MKNLNKNKAIRNPRQEEINKVKTEKNTLREKDRRK
jgi:hypothetical protein